MKWSLVVVCPTGDIIKFVRCLRKLAMSVDFKRTELIISGYEHFISTHCMNLLREVLGTELAEKVKLCPSVPENTLAHLYNLPALVAEGEYLCFLDESTVVSDNFLTKMTFGLVNYGKKYQSDDPVFVSPMNNLLLPSLGATAETVDSCQDKIDKQPEEAKSWAFTSSHSRHCFLVLKSVWQEVLKGVDERFVGNDTLMMTDLMNRLWASGHVSVLATDVVIAISDTTDSGKDLFHAYYMKPVHPEAKLAVLYRVKLLTDRDFEIFAYSLNKTVELGDVFILDDNSKVKVSILLKERYPEIWSKLKWFQKYSRAFDEKRDWVELYERAREAGYTWALAVEGDEVPEAKLTKDYLENLMNSPNPQVFGYSVVHYFLWDSIESWRLDNFWGHSTQVRLARILPNRTFKKNTVTVSQYGYFPGVPKENIRPTSIRFKSFAFVDPEDRQTKKDFYQKVDVKNFHVYEPFTQDRGLVKYQWKELNTLSVYSPVKNGGTELDAWLDHVRAFFDEVVVGDDGLSSGDLQKLKIWGVKVVPTQMKGNYGHGRNLVIKECTCHWIMQLDLDERIDDFNCISRMTNTDDQAFMFSILNLQKDNTALVTNTTRLFRNNLGLEYWGYIHETIDDAAQKRQLRIGWSPTKLLHYGYLYQTDVQAYEKMQRYLDMNLSQLKDYPLDGRAYFNLSLHLLQDGLTNEALRCLQIAATLYPNPYSMLQLAKVYAKTSANYFQQSLKLFPPQDTNVPFVQSVLKSMEPALVEDPANAKGHCISFLIKNPLKREWLAKLLDSTEEKIREMSSGKRR